MKKAPHCMPGFGLVHVLAEGRASVPTTGLLHEPKKVFSLYKPNPDAFAVLVFFHLTLFKQACNGLK
jgi:hypothetical protein